jgi:glucose-1-phosphate thymidylyltransferase
MIKKGIILAGGMGTRMSPLTKAVNKQLLPIHDKPLIFYPLSIFMLAKIKDILIIVNKGQLEQYKKLLSNGKRLGIKINYIEQDKPRGLPDAFKLGENFIKKEGVAMILGDNFFYGQSLSKMLFKCVKLKFGAKIILHKVANPEKFGIATVKGKKILSLKEKPKNSKSNLAITGLYFFSKDAPKFCENLTKSSRNEFEIIELLKIYQNKNLLKHKLLGRGFIWFDAGTASSLVKASNFIESLQNRQGLLVGSPEEVAYNKGWLPKEKIIENICKFNKSSYVKNLLNYFRDN